MANNPTITNFLSTIKGGARPTLYEVQHNFPDGIGGGEDVKNSVRYFIKGAQLPGLNIGVISTYFMGREVPLAGDRTFDELTLTMYNDVDFGLRNKYEKWANLINAQEANTGTVIASEYMVDIVVNQLDRNGNVLKSYTFVGCFPTNVAPIDLAADATDQIEEFTVSLRYAYWKDETNEIV